MPLSLATFRDQFDVFEQRLAAATGGGRFRGFDLGLPAAWEGYKGPLRDLALERLDAGGWTESEIGSRRILEGAVRAIEITRSQGSEPNNLTRWENRFGHANRSHHRLLEARNDPALKQDIEAALFAHFRETETAARSFARLKALVGSRYDLLAYLFFLRDWDRYMPIATRTFDQAFHRLGLELTMSHNASWENYSAYNAALGDIQAALRQVPGAESARLVDAHSFCWMLVRPELQAGYAAVKARPREGRDLGRTLDAREKSIVIMVRNAVQTAQSSNGQTVEAVRKNKELAMTPAQLEALIKQLLELQQDRCALTGIPLQWYGDAQDSQLLPSLDRIDSDGHYASGNLQVVCRFVNKWKSSDPDEEFRRLLSLVREGDAAQATPD